MSDGRYQIPHQHLIELVSLIQLGRIAVNENDELKIKFDFNLVYLVQLNENQPIIPLNLRPHSHNFSIFSLQFSVDGSEIICGSNDTCVYIFDLQKHKRTLRVNRIEKKMIKKKFFFSKQVEAHHNDVNAVRFIDNSNSLIVSGSDDGLVLVWDRRALNETQPKPVGIFAGHTSGITFVHSRVGI